ncbi:DYH8-like protein, partial [Mya arenaria]
MCIYFTRLKTNINITMKNVAEEVNFGSIDMKDTTGILNMFETVMSHVFVPVLAAQEKWGEMADSASGRKTVEQFMDNLNGFVTYMQSAQANAGEGVRLAEYEGAKVDIAAVKGFTECIQLASNPDVVADMEDLTNIWCRQIEQILAECDQMRKEADDTGPMAELEHWRQMMARFNSLLDQIKCHQCRTVISIINTARSKVMKKWKELDKRITDNANEARDNVKFLYSLEKYCEPLYRRDPVSMVECLGGLLNVIRMIHSISRYYNTSERMTSLFIKITNQMVTACKLYIMNNSTERIWDMERQPLIEKLQHCVNLYRSYQDHFHKTKQRIENTPDERRFEFSEMYIFGKFETFCKRIEKIITLLKYISNFSSLAESKIEGLDPYSNRFQLIFTSIKKKQYDVLDQRKLDFDLDYDDFRRQLADL